MLVAGLITRVAPTLHDLDARLRADGARFLDIGTGVGLLAVAMSTRSTPSGYRPSSCAGR